MSDPLYTRDTLRLALDSAAWPLLADRDVRVERRTPLCGSRITLDLCLDGHGRVTRVGMAVQACAFGQASAALLARPIVGLDAAAITTAHAAIAAWLADDGAPLPDWPDIALLAAARPKSARHAAILLPFDAASVAAAQAQAQAAAQAQAQAQAATPRMAAP